MSGDSEEAKKIAKNLIGAEPYNKPSWQRIDETDVDTYGPLARAYLELLDEVGSEFLDRTLCACGSMHYHCRSCGAQLDACSDDSGGQS